MAPSTGKSVVASAFALALAFTFSWATDGARAQPGSSPRTSGPGRTDLRPKYPPGRACSPMTSLYSSWNDVDGSKRDEPHSGIDAGRLGDPILAPADGTVIAVWKANWGWGDEGALLIRHRRQDLGLEDGPDYYYSEFDHLRYDEVKSIEVGAQVKRGETLAKVYRPGGKGAYPPEVHWEVWSITDDSATKWSENEHEREYWRNPTGHLVNPLYMLSLGSSIGSDARVEIPPFDEERDYHDFRGFTYILPCPRKG
jgi:murein DD-endopeptidase MepM/ murein hydrolase activator NlpD